MRGIDSDELIPKEGKDDAYDEVSGEIASLEKSLENELKAMRKSTGYVSLPRSQVLNRAISAD
jgi:hypothetical protein